MAHDTRVTRPTSVGRATQISDAMHEEGGSLGRVSSFIFPYSIIKELVCRKDHHLFGLFLQKFRWGRKRLEVAHDQSKASARLRVNSHKLGHTCTVRDKFFFPSILLLHRLG